MARSAAANRGARGAACERVLGCGSGAARGAGVLGFVVAAAGATGEEIWSPRSNIKTIPVTVGDLDGDGAADLLGGSQLLGGSLPGGAVISAMASPGNPIGGISIKGGKNNFV